MSTSPLEYPVTLQSTAHGTAKLPLDAFSVRNVMLNNLCHYADEAGQVRVNFALPSSSVSGGQGYLVPGASVVAGTFYWITRFTFPICVRASQRSYKLRVRVGGSTGGSGTAYFYLALAPSSFGAPPEGPLGALPALSDRIFTASTTGTGAAWITGTSGRTGNATTIELSRDELSEFVTAVPTLTDLAGSLTSVTLAMVDLVVYCSSSNTSVPRLYAVYAAENIGIEAT